MKRSDFIKEVSRRSGSTLPEARVIVDTFFNSITETLAEGGSVGLRGFGSFTVRKYQGYLGRNPKTKEIVSIKPKKLPYFKCGKELKDRLNCNNRYPVQDGRQPDGSDQD